MRDLDRWKDKVELQLDGRQIFFLFFGSAICACLIFVLGVMVGKRVEARTMAQAQAPAADPLAALDELGSVEEGLTFHSALSDKRSPKVRSASSAAAQQGDAGEGPGDRQADKLADSATKPAGAKDGEPGEGDKPGDKKDDRKAALLDAAKPDKDKKPAAKAKLAAAVAKDIKEIKTAKEAQDGKDAKADSKNDPKAKSHFTLQLSAFATKGEATDFIRRLKDSGYKPFMTESLIPGKGLMYRVRLGDFASRDTALSAKGDFERKQKMVAYVAKL